MGKLIRSLESKAQAHAHVPSGDLLILAIPLSIKTMKKLMSASFFSLALSVVLLGNVQQARSQEAIDLFPIEIGSERVYEVVKFGPYYPCRTGLEISRIVGTTQVNGREAYVADFCGVRSYLHKDQSRVYVFHAPENRWILALDNPEDGLRWEEYYALSEWREIGDYFVSDMLYQNCFEKRRLVSYEHFAVYCDGVGLVHERMIDQRRFGWDRKLRSILTINEAK